MSCQPRHSFPQFADRFLTPPDATEESLKRYVAFPREEGFQRTSLKARLGPPPNRPGRREAREPRENDQTERRPFRSSIESRLGPKPNQEVSEVK